MFFTLKFNENSEELQRTQSAIFEDTDSALLFGK